MEEGDKYMAVQFHAQNMLSELRDKKLEYISIAVGNILDKSTRVLSRYEPEIYEQTAVDTSCFTIDDISEAISARLRYPSSFMLEYTDLMSFLESVREQAGTDSVKEIVEKSNSAFRNLDLIERFLRGRNNGKTI
jgi:hypothetical protein